MPGEEFLGVQEQRRGLLERTRENSARLARSYASHTTTGWGEILVPTPILFHCTFLGPPVITTGVVVQSSNGVNSDENGPLVTGRFPRVDAGVWRWVQDINDHYTGAYVYFVVESVGFQFAGGIPPVSGDPAYVLTHHLVFEGVSYKDFNPAKLDY